MPKMFSNIKLVIFDVNETMFSLQTISEKFEILGLPKLALNIWFSNILKEGFSSSSIGHFHSFKKIAENELIRLFLSFKVEYKKKFYSLIMKEFSKLQIHDDVLKAIKVLHKNKIKIVLLTNGSKENTQNLLKKNNIQNYINRCFSIDEIKVWKPHKKVYQHVCKTMKISCENSLMIAAHAWDINGAKNAGLITGYITRYEKILSNIYDTPDIIGKDCLSILQSIKLS